MAEDTPTSNRSARIAARAAGGLAKAKDGGRNLVARANESYREWSTDTPIEPVGPGHLLPEASPSDAPVAELLQAADPLGGGVPATSVAGLAIDPDAIVLAELIMAASIAAQNEHDNADRYQRMERYVWNRQLDLQQVTNASNRIGVEPVLRQLVDEWSLAQRMLLLVEAAASNPFSPYEIAWNPNHELAGLAHLATVLDLAPTRATDIASTFAEAANAHSSISLTRVGLYGVGAAAVLGGAGLLAAAPIGAAIGGAMGLSGAAATSGGLGLLGSMSGAGAGSLTAGGMWLVAQVGATTGALAGAGGSFLYELGAAQAQNEIIKLQVTYKMILVDLQRNDAAALEVLGILEDRVAQLEGALEDERDFSDPGSSRITDMEATLTSLKNADAWMSDQLEFEDEGDILIDVRSLDLRIGRLERRILGTSQPEYSSDARTLRDLINPSELARIDDRIDCRFAIRAELDRWDVIAAVASGITAAALDHFVVATPATGITSWLRDNAAITSTDERPPWLKTLERIASVPYDQSTGDGFTPNNHRAKTPGHDPLIGLILGTRDIMHGTMTIAGGSNGELVRFVDNPNFDGLDHPFSSLLTQIAHLISDVVTPAGLPLPGWSVLTTLTPGIADTAVGMYRKGYDTWHLAPMAVPVASIHLTTSAWWTMREAAGEDITTDRKDALKLLATGIAATADLASMLAVGGNPVALNYVTWLDLARHTAKRTNRRAYRSALVTIDDTTRNQHLLNHGWTALLG